MATFKHISSKNADYGAAEHYLTFEHDEFTMKPTLDKNGRLLPRDDYRISSLNCGDEDFAIACMRSNLKYGKNQKREDVKSHHYIISFDPRDAPDNGLTVDRAQALGEQFCKEHFPGHQALVCTHPDGHNHSGNIHVHIIINSLRIAEVPLLPYMERPADTREGCKHRCTDAAMEYFKAEVMEMCHRENLYQIDLLNGSKNHAFVCEHTEVDQSAACHGLRIAEKDLETMLYEIISRQAQVILNVENISNASLLDAKIAKQTEYGQRVESCLDRKRVLYEQVLLKEISMEEYKAQKAGVDTELERLRKVHNALTAEISQAKMDAKAKNARLELAQEISAASGLSTSLADALIERVDIYPGNQVDIVWKMKDFCMEGMG